jgi:UDP-glucose 4-epimerase
MIGVYGANGFIGRHLVRRLVAARRPVRAVSRDFGADFVAEMGGHVDFVRADLGNALAMASSLQDVETVVQLVSTSSPGLQNRYAITDIQDNVIPHVAFLQSCVAAGVTRCVFLSSGGTVYGPGAPLPTPETAATDPISSHGLTKLFVEKYLQMHSRVDGLEHVILRLSNPFGPGQIFRKAQGLIPAILARHAEGQPIRVFGEGLAGRDYVYIGDVIDAIVLALDEPRAKNSVINIGSGQARTVMEVIRSIESLLGTAFELDFVPARNTDVDNNALDVSRARMLLDWSPRTSFMEGLDVTLRWQGLIPATSDPSADPRSSSVDAS